MREIGAGTTLLTSPEAVAAFHSAPQPDQETRADLLLKLGQALELCTMRSDALSQGTEGDGTLPDGQDETAELVYSVQGKAEQQSG